MIHGALPLLRDGGREGGRGGVNFEKFKSLGGESFFSSYAGVSPYGGIVIMVATGWGGGHNSGQINYHTITFLFKEK